ncbi:uncharacterized, partial [Tachysurus ichikawai]
FMLLLRLYFSSVTRSDMDWNDDDRFSC